MKLVSTGAAVVGGVAVVAAVMLVGCSNSSDTPEAAPITSSASAALATVGPTVDELDADLRKVLDPAVPNSEKLLLIQGIDADQELPGKLALAYQENKATITVKSVRSTGVDSASAGVEFSIDGSAPTQAVVPVVREQQRWKIEHSWACNALVNLNLTSPACP